MKNIEKIRLLESRLQRLKINERMNYGICRKLQREIRKLQKE